MQRAGLLERGADGAVELHPMLRRVGAAYLARTAPEATREAHRRLFERLLEGLPAAGPLPEAQARRVRRALRHGVEAGRASAAWAAFRTFLLVDEEPFAAAHGYPAEDLAALGALFEQPFTAPSPELPAAERMAVGTAVGAALAEGGRMEEAEGVLAQAMARREPGVSVESVAAGLALVRAARGRLDAAREACEVVGPGEPGRPGVWTARATVLHRSGRMGDAQAAFEAAWTRREPASARPFSGREGLALVELLVDRGLADEAARRAEALRTRLRHGPLPGGRALAALAGAVALAGRDRGAARALLDEARGQGASHGHGHGQAPGGPLDVEARGRALLLEAQLWRPEDRDAARRLVEEALALAVAHGLRLLECDALLARAAVDAESGAVDALAVDLDRAGQLIEDTGYALRRADAALWESRLGLARGDRARAQEALARARGLAEELRLGRLEEPLGELTRGMRRRPRPVGRLP